MARTTEQRAWLRRIGAELLERGLPVAAKEQWTRWYEASDDSPAERLRACNALGLVALKQHDCATARAHYLEASALAAAPEVPAEDRVKVVVNRSHLAYTTGDCEAARDLLAEATSLSVTAGLRDAALLGRIQLTLSAVHIAAERWQEAAEAATEARWHLSAAGRTDLVAHAVTNLGLVDLEQGRFEAAQEELLMAREMHIRNKDPVGTAHDLTELGRLYFRRNQLREALSTGQQALAILLADATLLDRFEVARLNLLFGAINLSEGRKGPALSYLNRAAAYFAQLGFRREWDHANYLTREALALSGPTRMQMDFGEEERQLNYLTSVLDLTDDIESVDEGLRGHSERVASLALVIGRHLRLPAERMHALGHAARLHDVGRVAGVEHHAETGERMARAFPLPEESLLAIRHHHEHVDGSGTPDGLIGDDIPELARIIALADTYDHLTSASGESLWHSQALGVMQGQAGVTVDHRLVDALIALHQVGKEVQV